MKRHLPLLACALLYNIVAEAQQPDLVKYVNTLQGTNSSFELTRGNTYPTTALPFAMHTWTPQTGRNGDGWKYQYAKKTIRGFQQAHQCSSWSNDYAVFSFMPLADSLVVDEDARATRFSHVNEVAGPHYYKVRLDNGITTEISPTERGAHLRFGFAKGKKSFLVLDGYTGLADVQIHPKTQTITGYVNNGRGFRKGWKSFFIARFNKPFKTYGTWQKKGGIVAGDTAVAGRETGVYVEFAPGAQVQVKTASSYISAEQALLNLTRELGSHATLEQTRAKAFEIWNRHLNRILVEGDSEDDKATFYSCFFRASLFSRAFYEIDANGNPYYFSPYDGKVHAGYMYTDTGFWDTFRAQFPLNALLHPTMHGRYMAALLAAQEQCGWLPSWSFPSEAGSMVGNHAISLLADAWAKGIRTFDAGQALRAYHHEANNKGPWGPANGRDGFHFYNAIGYVPYPEVREATAKTLEYAYDDFCGYALAKSVNDTAYMRQFGQHMFNYRNVYDAQTGFMRGRDSSGAWNKNFDPTEWGGPYTEGNAWHWVWSVFHDVEGLIKLMGGNANFNAKLDAVFKESNKVNVGTYGFMIHEMTEMVLSNMGQYAHGNQPIQHMPYLYNYAGEPWKAQFHTREIMQRLYNATENGYPGDEDQGQTSSWYVLSALGFYAVCPGTDEYVLGSPLFSKATIEMENGKKFVIEAAGNSDANRYIQTATLNKLPYTRNFVRYADMVAGGELHFDMGAAPNKARGTAEADKPFSISRDAGAGGR